MNLQLMLHTLIISQFLNIIIMEGVSHKVSDLKHSYAGKKVNIENSIHVNKTPNYQNYGNINRSQLL